MRKAAISVEANIRHLHFRALNAAVNPSLWLSVLWAFAMSAFRSWQADSVDSGCSSCAQTSPPHPEPCGVGVNSMHGHPFAGQAVPYSRAKLQPLPVKVSGKGRGIFWSPWRCAPHQAGKRACHASFR